MDAARLRIPDFEIVERTLPEIEEWEHRLASAWDSKTGKVTRALSDDEQRFVLGEKLRCKSNWRYWAEHYAKIRSESGTLITIPLRRTQQIILKKLGDLEITANDRNDGVLALVLKSRQLGVSTLSELLIMHKALFYAHKLCLIASDTPESAAYLFDMVERVYENLPWWLSPTKTEHVKNAELVFGGIDTRIIVGWGNATRGQKGAARARLAQGHTINAIHCSELSTWNAPQQLDSSVDPALPKNPNTFGLYEGTALGRGNWVHDTWKAAERGTYRFAPIFIPWAVEVEKYSTPAPLDWTPTSMTIAAGAHVKEIMNTWCGISLTPNRDQLYWYERKREDYAARRQLHAFLAEFAGDPDEAFQHSGLSAFSPEALSDARNRAMPMCGLSEVNMDPTIDWGMD